MFLSLMVGAVVFALALFVVTVVTMARSPRAVPADAYMLKDDPQPQPDCALGLVTRNAAPPRSST